MRTDLELSENPLFWEEMRRNGPLGVNLIVVMAGNSVDKFLIWGGKTNASSVCEDVIE